MAFRNGRRIHGIGTPSRFLAQLVAVALLLTGCGVGAIFGDSASTTFFSESNYVTFDHAFTDAAADAARRSAERHCAPKKQVAVKTASACSLTRCTTSYQCMDRKDAAEYQK